MIPGWLVRGPSLAHRSHNRVGEPKGLVSSPVATRVCGLGGNSASEGLHARQPGQA